jgi:hypothetical protein
MIPKIDFKGKRYITKGGLFDDALEKYLNMVRAYDKRTDKEIPVRFYDDHTFRFDDHNGIVVIVANNISPIMLSIGSDTTVICGSNVRIKGGSSNYIKCENSCNIDVGSNNTIKCQSHNTWQYSTHCLSLMCYGFDI